MKQNEAPLWAGLKKYQKENITPFHMPGHKMGRSLGVEWQGDFSLLDVTEVPGTDDLHSPEDIILEAERLAAEAFGADESFFLVNGTSSGIMAMIMAVCNPGDKIIVPRNVHRSIMNGLIFSGARPIYVEPKAKWGISLGVTPEMIEKALDEYPDCKAVLLVSPTYYGVIPDLPRIIDLVHQRNKVVLVDEAHGAHLGFHPELPQSSLFYGADLSAQGAHKSLSAFTQSAFLHMKGDRIDRGRLRQSMQLVQSTSPSYLLMTSLDLARKQIAEEGKKLLDGTLREAGYLREEIGKIPGFWTLDGRKEEGFWAFDGTKLTIFTDRSGMTGWELAGLLREKYGIQVELSGYNHILLLLTLVTRREDSELLLKALKEFAKQGCLAEYPAKEGHIPEMVYLPREAWFKPKKAVTLDECLGRVAGEAVVPYPPGIPILVPGEKIDETVYRQLKELQRTQQNIQGIADKTLRTLLIID